MNVRIAPSFRKLDSAEFGSAHPGVCHFLRADGSVTAINKNISVTTLRYLGHASDGNVVDLP